jgi:hypothetical protein
MTAIPDSPRVALVGDPGTGKTTFLAAFYNAVCIPAGTISLNRHPETARYLEDIRQAWLRGEAVPHTPSGTGELIELDLAMSGRNVIVEIPDLNGESFRDVYANRQISVTVDDLLTSADSLLVCVSPLADTARVSLIQARRMGERGLVGAGTEPHRAREFEPEASSLDVKTVDLIQMIRERRRRRHPEAQFQRTALIVSAWDVLRPFGETPDAWVSSKMPMLHQFLRSNRASGDFRIFGVSAQGGEYGAAGSEAMKRPDVRAVVVDPEGSEHHDVTAPFAWAIGAS